MRNLALLLAVLTLGTTSTMAAVISDDDKVAERNAYRYNNSFIFVESGITFSVYPDGEFDFYIDNRLGRHRRDVTFNSGFDYSPYAQYDDYGAVIQVESVPIYYDFNGRVTQIGNVDINYVGGRVHRVGSMYVFYNRRGFYDYHTGYINSYNRFYTYRPFHAFFARPSLGFCLVFNKPYRRYYSPVRYTYYNPYRYNKRWSYAKIGREHRYNKTRRERSTVYRNDRRVAVNKHRAIRSNRTVARTRTSNDVRKQRAISNRNSSARNNGLRSTNGRKVANRTAIDRSKNIGQRTVKRSVTRPNATRTITKRSATIKSPRRNAVTKRTVTRTPQRKTVTRTTVKRPQARVARPAKRVSNNRSTVNRSATQRRMVSKTPSKSRNTYSRSSSQRRSNGNVARSSRSNTSRSVATRSSRRQ